jgi:hypothetical protein
VYSQFMEGQSSKMTHSGDAGGSGDTGESVESLSLERKKERK